MAMPSWPLAAVTPREVQERALERGYGKPGFAYFMRQRLGKTWVAYAEFTLLRSEGKAAWMVIICPNSLKQQWLEAIEQVDEYTPICIYKASNKARTSKFFDIAKKTGGVLIINYESVRAFMKDENWARFNPLMTYLVADESTKIKEPTTKMTKACHELAAICSYKRILTGKPSSNSNSDLWSQLKFIGATDRNYYQHKYTFNIVGGFQGRQIMKNINTDKLKEEMEPFCYIAEDKYIKGFEKIYEPPRQIAMSGDQAAMYNQMKDELLLQLSKDVKITAPIALVKYLRLQQISSGIAGDEDGTQHNIVDPFTNPRIRAVVDLLESEIDHKVIIICRFVKSIENLKLVLTKHGYKVAIMQGSMGNELDIQKRLFHEGDHDILLAQEQVLNFGHTLCGPEDHPCCDVIFFENSFSLINRSQCESRPEKYEREKPISYWDFYVSSMDKHILQSLIRKEDGAMAIMGYARKYGIHGNRQMELLDEF